MASLKEIKSRIQSVQSTQKITSAMKMVSSAKLRKAQRRIQSFYPYDQKLTTILNNFLSSETEQTSIYAEQREIKKVALVVISSNSSLCGAFNANVGKRLNAAIESYKHLGKDNIEVYSIGKKISQISARYGYKSEIDYNDLIENPQYKTAQEFTDALMARFTNKDIDKVEMIFHHFVSKSSQKLENRTLLPISLEVENDSRKVNDNYIVEPNYKEIMEELIPKVIRLQLYTALLDSNASEHAARTIAMQTATDNADDLLGELNLQYNKSRQQAITAELLDIIGGSFGQK